jgi:hypothetical protein
MGFIHKKPSSGVEGKHKMNRLMKILTAIRLSGFVIVMVWRFRQRFLVLISDLSRMNTAYNRYNSCPLQLLSPAPTEIFVHK